jgi:SSS family solute:Na+ symporter
MDGFGLIFGLGLVLGFGYWGTDFVQLQRALAVRRKEDAPFVSLSIGYAKLVFALLIALTGVAAPLVLSQAQLSRNWNATLPSLMLHYYTSVWLVFGMMGLAASLISTFSNNVAGFTSAWVQGIYQRSIHPGASDRHYTAVGRLTNAGVILLSIGAAYCALHFQSLMEYIQLVLATFNAPLFALVALAAITPHRAAASGRVGFLLGLGASVLHEVLVLAHVLRYGSQMSANFYGAVLGFVVALVSTLAIGWLRRPAARALQPRAAEGSAAPIPWTAIAAAVGLASLFVYFNLIFW